MKWLILLQVWNRVASDETLWRSLLRGTLKEPNCTLAPGKLSWKQEYKRVYYHSPVVHTETLREHTDEVLHVSFAHGGRMFSTTSKDATLRVRDRLMNIPWFGGKNIVIFTNFLTHLSRRLMGELIV